MMRVHPDGNISSSENYAYSAQEINIAYSVLNRESRIGSENVFYDRKKYAAGEKRKGVWNAPVNVNAYREREVLCYAEDNEGGVLGNFCVAKGKYLWKTEEDFPLFLLSMYRCSKQLLDEIDKREDSPIRQQIQTELAYLLAQQFIDGTSLLEELAKEGRTDKEGNRIFYISAMIELAKMGVELKTGEALYPLALRKHKLYLKNQVGQELGYLSFQDDRLYYIVVPLLEQKRVQVKIQVAEEKEFKRRKANSGYQKLDLWIKLPGGSTGGMPENLNLKIEQLLNRWLCRNA